MTSNLLCEIVGAQNLPSSSNGPLDRFCTIHLCGDDDEKVLHSTNVAKGDNPIWTITSNSLFLLCESLLINDVSLSFQVYSLTTYSESSFRSLNEKTLLGQVKLKASDILDNCNAERLEFDLKSTKAHENISLGKLALRFRIALPSDESILGSLKQKDAETRQTQFANHFLQKPKMAVAEMITETAETEVVQSSFMNVVNRMLSANVVYDTERNLELIRVKPYPDPQRKDKSEYMTSSQLQKQTYEKSQSWIQAGSGKLGTLYVEVLKCNDLPNMDFGETIGDVTDAFCTLVYEDTVAMTDVIDDELSPHWMPWSQRAFCFGMMHPSSVLYLGVFDYDLGAANDHDPIGRAVVNLSHLLPNTDYKLEYNLYPSSNVTARTANGSITIRVRIEIHDEKAALIAALAPRPKININVKMEKTFRVIRYTCFGEFDGEEKFDLTVTRSYINEILEYKRALSYTIRDSVVSLMFWRGQVDLFGEKKIKVPLYSFLFFVGASHLVEKPHLIVPFVLFSIAFMMMSRLTIKQQHPSPWHRCPSISQYIEILARSYLDAPGETMKSPKYAGTEIKAFQGDQEARAYEASIKKRLERDLKRAEEKAELQQSIERLGDDNISTEVSVSGGIIIPVDLQKRLARYQGYIGRVCSFVRKVRVIALWEENILSFWIAAAFFCAGLVSLILPWRFILLWTGRAFVWGLFGPHMKAVDLFLSADEDRETPLMKNIDLLFQQARLRREDAVKKQDIKVLAFGKFSVQVPSYNLARHYDRPLPQSVAVQASTIPDVQIEKLIPGQQLYGTMIPRTEDAALLFDKNHKNIMELRQKSSSPAIVAVSSESSGVGIKTHGEGDSSCNSSMVEAKDENANAFPENDLVMDLSEGECVEVGFMEDEGLEIMATDTMEPEDIDFLRTKSLDSVVFHQRKYQRRELDDFSEESDSFSSIENSDDSSGSDSSSDHDTDED